MGAVQSPCHMSHNSPTPTERPVLEVGAQHIPAPQLPLLHGGRRLLRARQAAAGADTHTPPGTLPPAAGHPCRRSPDSDPGHPRMQRGFTQDLTGHHVHSPLQQLPPATGSCTPPYFLPSRSFLRMRLRWLADSLPSDPSTLSGAGGAGAAAGGAGRGGAGVAEGGRWGAAAAPGPDTCSELFSCWVRAFTGAAPRCCCWYCAGGTPPPRWPCPSCCGCGGGAWGTSCGGPPCGAWWLGGGPWLLLLLRWPRVAGRGGWAGAWGGPCATRCGW